MNHRQSLLFVCSLGCAGFGCSSDAPPAGAAVAGAPAAGTTGVGTSGSSGSAASGGGNASAGSGSGGAGGGATAGSGGAAGVTSVGGASGAAPGGAGGSGGASLPEVSDEGDGDSKVGPSFQTQPELGERGNEKGKSFSFSMALASSKLFDGKDATLDPAKVSATRSISVYVPAAYRDGDFAPVLIIQDGPGPLGMIRNALDNLTNAQDASRKLPAFVAIAVQNGETTRSAASAASSTTPCRIATRASFTRRSCPRCAPTRK